MKKISYLCMLSLLCMLVFAGCKKDELKFENPYFNSENYFSGKHYVQMLIYGYGTLYMELDADAAPATVTNFLARVDEGFYNGLTIHRVVDGFMIQGGDPKGNGSGSSQHNIPGEFALNGHENPISHVRGTISMARLDNDYDSASCQFFIVQEDTVALDGSYAAFGTVVHGMDIVDAICEDIKKTDANGIVPTADQPIILFASRLSEAQFKLLKEYDFDIPDDLNSDNEENGKLDLTISMVDANHGNDVSDTWNIDESGKTYLIRTNKAVANVSLFALNLATMEYDKEKPLGSLDNVNAEALIEVKTVIPQDLPNAMVVVTMNDGTIAKYLLCYEPRKGGATLAPMEMPEAE